MYFETEISMQFHVTNLFISSSDGAAEKMWRKIPLRPKSNRMLINLNKKGR